MPDQQGRKDLAEAYRLAVAHGIVEPRQAVAWADRLIAASDDVDYALVDVASAWPQGHNQLAEALGRMPGTPDPDAAFRIVLALVDDEISRDPERIDHLARALYGVTVDVLPTSHPLYGEFVRIDDGLALARSGTYGTVAEAKAEVIRSVREHRAPRID